MFVYLLGTNLAQSQILNVEKSRMNKVSNEDAKAFLLNGSFGFKANNRSAAVDEPIKFLSVNSNLDLAILSEKNSFLLLNYLDYLLINDDPFISFGYSHLRINFLRQQFLSYEVFGQAQYDLLRGLDKRYLGGAGIRLNLINKEKFLLATGHGLMYEHEQWDNPLFQDDPDNFPEEAIANILKSANYVTFRWSLKEYLDMNAICYYQVGSFEDIMRHRLNADANLNVKINEFINFRVNFTFAYENEPIVPITKFIYSISNGIQFKISKNKSK